MEKSLSTQISKRIKRLNEWQRNVGRETGSFITFQTKRDRQGLYSLIRTYSDGMKQVSNKKTESEIVPFLDGFLKHYCL